MKDFEALKDIWSNQVEHSEIRPEDVLKKVKQSKNLLANKLLLEVIAVVTAIVILSYAWIILSFTMWTSHVAIGIFILCCIYVMFKQFSDYRKITDNALLLNRPKEYITYLKSYKQDRYILNTQKYRTYSILFSTGFLLFFVEILFIAELWVTVLAILFTLFWFYYCYFVLMKNYIRKEENRLDDMITNLERVEKQFSDEKLV